MADWIERSADTTTIRLDTEFPFGIFQAPKHAGYLTLAHGFDVAIFTKPHRMHLWAMRKVFGWTWRDAENQPVDPTPTEAADREP